MSRIHPWRGPASGFWAAVAVTLLAAAPQAGAVSYRSAVDFFNPGGPIFFGYAVAAAGPRAAIGAPGEVLNGLAHVAGVVHVYSATTGAPLHVVTDPNPATSGATSAFGSAVLLLGGLLIVGAPGSDLIDNGAGVVYVFDAATGALQRTIASPNPTQHMAFGSSLAAFGTDILVGQPGNVYGNATSGLGTVYRIDPSSGALQQTYSLADLNTGFGYAVAALGGDVLIGAPFDSALADDAGAAYLFDASTGGLVRALPNPDPEVDEYFGWSVAEVAGAALIGAPYEQTIGVEAGAAYLIDPTTGGLLHTLLPPTGSAGALFGWSAAGVGGTAAVGMYRTQRVIVFDATTGAALFTLRPPVPNDVDVRNYDFGVSLAVLSDRLLVGAAYDDTGADGLGAAYLFDPCGNGVVSAREHCDDGNTVDGDACPATCSYCDEGPAVACRDAATGKSSVAVKTFADPTHDQLQWKWKSKGDTVAADFGNPLAADKYALCLYDQSETATPRLRIDAALDPDADCGNLPCWTPRGNGGYSYRNRSLSPSGVKTGLLRASDSGSAKLGVKAKGTLIGRPDLPASGRVTVQLHRVGTAHECWSADFSSPTANGTGAYSARSD